MPVLDWVGWIIIGFFAGALSGLVIRQRTPGGCLANILVGVLGGFLGGFIAQQFFDVDRVSGWLTALVVAFVGAVIVRWLIALVTPNRRY